MVRSIGLRLAYLFSALVLSTTGMGVSAQEFPTKPIRIVVPFPAGGPVDAYARMIGRGLSEAMGQPVMIDNRAGASGIIGTQLVAQAAPDGYTLLVASSEFAVNPSLYKKIPYDAEKDFTPLTLIATNPNILAARVSFPASTTAELIALAKSKPGVVTYASTSIGGSNHLSAELLKWSAGIDLLHVPYKGTAPALSDLMGGQVDLLLTSVGPVLPLLKEGKLKGIAVTSAKRAKNLPNVPTIGETVPGFEVNSWFGMWGPAHMPPELVARLSREIVKVLNSADAKTLFANFDADVGGNSPEEFAVYQKAQMVKWAEVLKHIGLKLD